MNGFVRMQYHVATFFVALREREGEAVRKTLRLRWPSSRPALPIPSRAISIGRPRSIKALQLPRDGIDAHVARGGQDLFPGCVINLDALLCPPLGTAKFRFTWGEDF